MSGHLHSQRMGLIAGRLDQCRLHPQHARLPHHFGVHNAASDHQLDQVGLFRRDLLHEGRGLLRRAGLIGQRPGHVPAGYRHRHIGRHHPGRQDLAPPGRIANDRVEVRHAAHGTDSGHAGQQLRPGVTLAHLHADAAHQAVGGDELHQLLRVGGLFPGLAGGGQMHMQIDQPRQQVFAAQVHARIALRHIGRVADGSNAVPIHTDSQPRPRHHVPRTVQHHAVHQRIFLMVYVHMHPSCWEIFSHDTTTRWKLQQTISTASQSRSTHV